MSNDTHPKFNLLGYSFSENEGILIRNSFGKLHFLFKKKFTLMGESLSSLMFPALYKTLKTQWQKSQGLFKESSDAKY